MNEWHYRKEIKSNNPDKTSTRWKKFCKWASKTKDEIKGATKESGPSFSNHLDKDQKIKVMSLSGVKQYPMRIKCATLSWHTLTSAMEKKLEEVNTETID